MGIVRSSFLIGKTGKIEEVWPLVKAKGHATDVLKRIPKNQSGAQYLRENSYSAIPYFDS